MLSGLQQETFPAFNAREDTTGRDQAVTSAFAIVGTACRLPGNVNCPSDLWELLLNSRSGYCEIPETRFNATGFFHSDPLRPGSLPSTGGYFIRDDIRHFDNRFFGVNNLEAKYLDPQQRQLLEVAYECFENGGQSLETLSGSNTGCFVANFTNDFSLIQFKDAEYSSHYSGTGAATSILANRLNHIFNLRGPSLVVDTACSSSLYALHLACNALKNHDCEAALVASANLIQSPEQHLQAVKAGILSPDATCHTYDSSANGYGRAEGVCALFVKCLSDAIRDKDPIQAIIRGTALNRFVWKLLMQEITRFDANSVCSNGRTTGISLPDPSMQASVVAQAYRQANLCPQDTGYVESHGTGTPVGDPIELEGLRKAFRPTANASNLLVGSVKTNLGHSEGASGLTSVLKVVLALQNKVLPPTIGINSVNPRLVQYLDRISIVTECQPWPESSVFRASVNSFGFGGANGHAILEDPVYLAPRQAESASKPDYFKFLLPFSARSQESLTHLAGALVDYCRQKTVPLEDLAYTLGSRRSMHSHRAFAIASASMGSPAIRPPPNESYKFSARLSKAGRLAFIFTGQGAQWLRMASGLLTRFEKFQRAISHLDAILKTESSPPSWSLTELLESPQSWDIHKAEISQPLCTAVQIGLIDVLSAWGIHPAFVVGHSSGEIAAAYCSGAITAREAILVAYYRGLAVASSVSAGRMAAIGLDHRSVEKEIQALNLTEQVMIACINSGESVTISGDLHAVDLVVNHFQRKQIFVRSLRTDGNAYHSHHMHLIGQKYEAFLSQAIGGGPGGPIDQSFDTRLISSVSGAHVKPSELRSPQYWRSNLESPVQFKDAIEKLSSSFDGGFVEIGPHPALQMPVKHTWSQVGNLESIYLPTLNRNEEPTDTLLYLAGSLFTLGFDVKMDEVNQQPSGRVLTDMPTYPWNHDSVLWHESTQSYDLRNRRFPRHYILGSLLPSQSSRSWSWRNVLRIRDVTWLSDHKVGGVVVLPAAAFINAAIEALKQRCDLGSRQGLTSISEMSIAKALLVPDDEAGIEVLTTLHQRTLSSSTYLANQFDFEFSSRIGEVSTFHADGIICFNEGQSISQDMTCYQQTRSALSAQNWYKRLKVNGLEFGPAFQLMSDPDFNRPSNNGESGVCAKVALINSQLSDQSACEDSIHLCLLDSLLQASIISNTGGDIDALRGRIPVSFETVLVQQGCPPTVHAVVSASSSMRGAGVSKNNATMYASQNDPIVQIRGVRLVEYANVQDTSERARRRALLRIDWKPSLPLLRHSDQPALSRFISREVSKSTITKRPPQLLALEAVLNLEFHHSTGLRVLLLLGDHDHGVEELVRACSGDVDGLQRVNSVVATYLQQRKSPGGIEWRLSPATDEGGTFSNGRDQGFDMVIACEPDAPLLILKEQLRLPLKDGISLVTLSKSRPAIMAQNEANSTGSFSCLYDASYFDGAQRYDLRLFRFTVAALTSLSSVVPRPTYLVYHEELTDHDLLLQEALQDKLSCQVTPLCLSSLLANGVLQDCTVVCTANLSRPSLLATMTAHEFQCLQHFVAVAQNIFWITSGSTLDSRNPESSLVLGLSRALMLEQPALKFRVVGLGPENTMFERRANAHAAVRAIEASLSGSMIDFELACDGGLLYSSRFVPDVRYNDEFNVKQATRPIQAPLLQEYQYQLSLDHPGNIDRLYWKEKRPQLLPDSDGFVQVQVEHYGLNFKDLAIADGDIDVTDGNSSFDCLGVVLQTSASTSTFKTGDRVLTMAPQKICSQQIVPEWACVKVSNDDDPNIVTLPLVFSTAIYALERRAQIQQHESVLIHCAASGLGQALVQIAQLRHAKIYATTSTQEKKDFLTSKYGLDPACVFSSREPGFAPKVLGLTNGNGVDIVVNCLNDDFLDESLRCCSAFGRFVEVGQRNSQGLYQLGISRLRRNVSIIPIELTDLFYSGQECHRRTWQSLLRETIRLFRAGEIRLEEPFKIFGMDEVVDCFKALQSVARIGKVVLDVSAANGLFATIQPIPFRTRLSPTKHYVMVGCLGGLGRSITQWMIDRGARKFTFLNPSGIDKPPAAAAIQQFKDKGAKVLVVRGQVDSQADVLEAISKTEGIIGGVVHAAMGLSEALFSTMTCEQWHKAIRPKLQGSWNLHTALRGREAGLDFFILTSSISGSVGTATESNYCAANSFLDAFARYRRSQGLKAVSVGFGMISEVGYLHEHPDIEKLLLRKGIHPINESELQQIIDMAIAWESEEKIDPQQGDGHLLTGLELVGLDAQRQHGFEGHSHVLEDPRSSLLAFNFWLQSKQNPSSRAQNHNLEWILKQADREELTKKVGQTVASKVANLVLIERDRLSQETRLGDFGMDSMLAAEFRGHIFHLFQVDVPFMMILGSATIIKDITHLVVDRIIERRSSNENNQ